MAKAKTDPNQKTQETAPDLLTKVEHYIEENQKSLLIIVGIIVALIASFIGYKKLYVAPKEDEAQEQIYIAQNYFQRDSFKLALNGDGNFPGFQELADDYGVTKAGNLAHYYAGICFLKLGKYEDAIEYLKNFETNDNVLGPESLGAIGAAYSELGQYEDAAKFYKKAADNNKNDFTRPYFLQRAAEVYEELKDYESALKMYETIQSEYPNSTEGRQVEKYITRAKIKLNKA
jgi:tetratricopeptide (TPR) repeat protein